MTDQVKPHPLLSDEEIQDQLRPFEDMVVIDSELDVEVNLAFFKALCAQAKRYPAMVETLEIAKENFEHFSKPSFYAQYIASPSTCESLAHGAQVAIKQLEAALKGETPQ